MATGEKRAEGYPGGCHTKGADATVFAQLFPHMFPCTTSRLEVIKLFVIILISEKKMASYFEIYPSLDSTVPLS